MYLLGTLYYKISRDLQYFLISHFAQFKLGVFLIPNGALFHSMAVSLLKLSLAALDLASSFQIFIELALMFLPWSSLPWMLDSSWIGNNYARPFRFLE